MDNQTHNTENAWLDSKLAALVLPSDWHPNSKRAYSEFLNRRESNEPETSSSWIRLSMAAAILAAIGMVVTLLPWHQLWKPAAKNAEVRPKILEAAKAPHPIAVPEPIRQKTSQQALSQSALPQALGPEYSDESRRAHIQGTASLQPQPPEPGTGGAILQTPQAAQEPEQKPAERVGPRATPPRAIAPTLEPSYTDEARLAHVQGAVVLEVIVRKDGTGKVQKVVQGLGYGLDEKAIEAFEKWTFTPGTIDGKPVDVQFQVTINFHLY